MNWNYSCDSMLAALLAWMLANETRAFEPFLRLSALFGRVHCIVGRHDRCAGRCVAFRQTGTAYKCMPRTKSEFISTQKGQNEAKLRKRRPRMARCGPSRRTRHFRLEERETVTRETLFRFSKSRWNELCRCQSMQMNASGHKRMQIGID